MANLGKEVRPHQPVSLRTLCTGCVFRRIWFRLCCCISLPSRHSTVVPCWQSTPCRRCRRSSPPPLGQRSVAGRSINSTHDTRRPRLSCGCGQSMERPSANDQGLTVAADVPTTLTFLFQSTFYWLNNDGFQWIAKNFAVRWHKKTTVTVVRYISTVDNSGVILRLASFR